MGTVVQLLEKSAALVHTPADANQAEATRILRGAVAEQIVAAASAIEILSQNINTMQGSLQTLVGVVGVIGDAATHEELQRQLKSVDAMALLESARLSRMHRTVRFAMLSSECLLRMR